LCPNKKPFDAPSATNKKANLPPRKPVSLSVKKWNTFARESMAPELQSKPLPSACARLAVLASIFLLLPARHHPLARRRTSSSKSSRKRVNSSLRALRREGSASASPAALSRFAKASARKRFRKPSSRRRESCANQVSQSAEAAPLITKLERDCASVEAALRRHLVGRSLALTARAWRLPGLRPEEMVLIFPSVWYIKSSIPLPPNPDSEFLPLDSYSPLALLPARISPADLNFVGC
jgi:hypothetical protein